MKRSLKEPRIAVLTQYFKENNCVMLLARDKMTVKQSEELRFAVRQVGGRVEVVPNRIVKIAVERASCESAFCFKGENMFIFSKDPLSLCSAVHQAAQASRGVLTIKNVFLDGADISLKAAESMAKAASAEGARTQSLILLLMPHRKFLYTLYMKSQQLTEAA